MQLMVRPLLSNAATNIKHQSCKQVSPVNGHSLIANGSLEDGTRNSPVGSTVSAESTLTTFQVDEESAIEHSSGMKASLPSVSFASRAIFRDLARVSR